MKVVEFISKSGVHEELRVRLIFAQCVEILEFNSRNILKWSIRKLVFV